MRNSRRRSGAFSTLELMVVVGILGLLAAAAVPSWRVMQANNRLRDASADVLDAMSIARARAIASGNRFIVYFNTGLNGGTDLCGTDLADANGNPVPILVLEDDVTQNCCIDAGEEVRTLPAAPGVEWGVDFAAGPAPGDDDPLNLYAGGSTFQAGAGAAAEWVAFARDGMPRGFPNLGGGCVNLNELGSGGGAIYINNNRRDAAVVLSPLGSLRVHQYEKAGAAWND
jgi:type II secretory pathway pseudopilin PulG